MEISLEKIEISLEKTDISLEKSEISLEIIIFKKNISNIFPIFCQISFQIYLILSFQISFQIYPLVVT